MTLSFVPWLDSLPAAGVSNLERWREGQGTLVATPIDELRAGRRCGGSLRRNNPTTVAGVTPMSASGHHLLSEIHRGARLIFENAEELYDEAQTLGMKGAFSRAVCLHQISLEECSKIDILGAAATSLLMGDSVDLATLARAMRNHRIKNFNLAYSSQCTPAEREARERGDHKEVLKIFREQQKTIHDELNTNKNASLYVDFIDGRFLSPKERITEGLAVAMQAFNGRQLAICETFLGMLSRMVTEPEKQSAIVQDALRHLQSASVDQFPEVLESWLNHAKRSFGK